MKASFGRVRGKEMSRQLVHFSGVLFILIAQFMLPLVAAATFFLIAMTFLLYSFYIVRERNRFSRVFGSLERRVRGKIMHFEREGVPLQGAFWFYFGCAVAFALFPLGVATMACLILAVSDSLATLIGHHKGKRTFFGGKTVEGTLAFYLSALVIGAAFMPHKAIVVAIAATVGELLPALFPGLRNRGILDDNLTIPLLAGATALL